MNQVRGHRGSGQHWEEKQRRSGVVSMPSLCTLCIKFSLGASRVRRGVWLVLLGWVIFSFSPPYVKQRPKETQIRGHNGRFKEALNLRSQVTSLLTGYLSKSGPIHLNERKTSPFTAIYLNLNTFPVLCRQPATAILAVFMAFLKVFSCITGGVIILNPIFSSISNLKWLFAFLKTYIA